MQNLAQSWLIVLLVDPVSAGMLRHGGTAVGAGIHAASKQVEANANLYSGWVNFAGGAPIFVLTLFAGVLADKVSKRNLLLVTQSILVFTATALGLLCITGRVQIWHVIFFAALSGCVVSFDLVARQSFVVELVGKDDLASAISLNSSIFNGARAIGPGLAGLLLAAQLSIGVAFLANAGLTLFAVAALLLLRLPAAAKKVEAESAKSRESLWSNIREGFRYVRTSTTIMNLLIVVGTFGLFALSFNVLVPAFIKFTLLPNSDDAYQVKAFGVMETVRGVGALIGALTVAFLGSLERQKSMLIAGSVVSVVLLILFSWTRNLYVAYVIMSGTAFGFVVCFATCNTLIQSAVPNELRGRIMSIYSLMFIGTAPFGGIASGMLARMIGAPHTVFCLGLVSLIILGFVVLRRGGIRDLSIGPIPYMQKG